MGNNVKGYKQKPSKRYSGTERSGTDINNSIDSTNFNFSSDNRKNMSFYSNNEYIDNDRELNNEEISRSFKTEGFSVKNNLEEIRNRNFKTIEYSNSRKKRLESIKEIEKKLDDINACNQNNLNNLSNIDLNKNLNNKNFNNHINIRGKEDANAHGELNSESDFGLRKTTTFFKSTANFNDNSEQTSNRFDRRLTVDLHRHKNNFNNSDNNNQINIGFIENQSKNKQRGLKDKDADDFIEFNALTNNRQVNLEKNRYNDNRINEINNRNSNYRSIGFREASNHNNINRNIHTQNNVLDLKSLIQQSVNNVNDMNRRFTQMNDVNPANNADSHNNRGPSQNSDYNSNAIQVQAGHHRVHSHSVNPENKIHNPNVNLNQNNLNFDNNNNNNSNYNLNMRSIERDDSITNSLNNSNVNLSYYNDLNKNNNKNNTSIISNNDYKIKINSSNQLNSEGNSNKNSFNRINFTDKNIRNDFAPNLNNNFQSNKNLNGSINFNNFENSFNLNNLKSEELNINNNYASANNSLLTDYFDNNNNNNNVSVKSSNLSLGRKNIFEEESNKREKVTTMSLTEKINKIKAERELSQDCRIPEQRKLNSVYNPNNKVQNFNSSLSNNNIIKNFSSEKKNNVLNENDFNINNYRNEVKLGNGDINNNNNSNQVNYNSASRVNADNIKFINDSKNFEIIYEKEEEGISKNPSALYDLAKQASHEEIRKSVSNFPENNSNGINMEIDSTNKLMSDSNINEARNNNIISVGNTLDKNKNTSLNSININNRVLEDKNSNIRGRLSVNSAFTNPIPKNEPNQMIKNPNLTQVSNTNSITVNKHYSTEVTDSNLNYVLTLNDNINNSKEFSPKSITSNSNYFMEKTQNNLNTSENDLALQSHRITESIKNIMNSNNILNYPELGNYYNTISFINTDEDANAATNKSNRNVILPLNSAKNIDNKPNKNLFGSGNKRISFKNTEDIPIVTGEILANLKSQSNNSNLNSNGKKNSLLNSNNKAKKNILLDKKNQFSQKTIGNKNDLSNITSKKFSLKEKTLVKNTKLTSSLSSIKSFRKENKLGVNNSSKINVKPKTFGNSGYQNTEPVKPTKREDPIKNLPISSRNKNPSKLGISSFNNTTLVSESNENVKKNFTNRLNADNNLKKNTSRRNLSVSTNPVKKPSLSSSLNSKLLNTSLGSSFFGNRLKGKNNEAKNCICKCKCVKCKNNIDFIAEEPELEGKLSLGVNNPSLTSVTNSYANFKIFENLQAKNFLEFLFIISDLSLTNLNANSSTKNIIQNFKNSSIFSSKQIFNDLLRVLKSLMDNSLNFNIDEETYNRNNVSNFSANSSFFNLSFEKRRSELNRRRDERKNAKIIFIQKKWREYKLRKILKTMDIDFFANSKADISNKCKNYILESLMKNSKMPLIFEYFNKSMVLWNELFNCPRYSNIKNSLIQVKQIEMDNIINFDSNSLLHSIASKAITTHLLEKEIKKEDEAKLAAKPKLTVNTAKENLLSKNDKKNVSFTSRTTKPSKIMGAFSEKK